jgi:hypothetical protein
MSDCPEYTPPSSQKKGDVMARGDAERNIATATESNNLFSRATVQMRQFVCGLHGHDALLHFERGRISLLCASCGHESPGWDLSASASQPHEADARRARVTAVPFVRQRRAA